MTSEQNDYRRKIKTREELRQTIGRRPRHQSVVMCHGAFDLVHPGHVRHLMYARGKSDILIASLTSDAHIAKSNYRPFVPQELRAMNLAALEVVDYVIIDNNPTPIKAIKYLQPDYFAKGYEYSDGKISPNTQKEIEALNSYGGEMIFTPGDVVFSSSTFIDLATPKLSYEKLVTLMETEKVVHDDLKTAMDAFKDVRVHVIGDTIIDSYVYCSLIGSGATKTPTLSVRQDRQVDFVGGAAIVAKHIRRAGAQVKFSTVLGNDTLKDFIMREMDEYDIDTEPFIDPTRVTTQKNAFIASGHRMLKVDKVDNRPITEKTLELMKESLSSSDADVFIFSDFRHGIFSRRTIPQLTTSLPPGKLRVADSQVASRWGNILDFQGFDLITPNEREARFALGDQDSVIRPLCLELYKKAKCKTLILKLGDRGTMTYRSPSYDAGSFFSIDSFADNVVDAVGAGDALLAYATLSLAASKSTVVASILGNMAAALACEYDGNIPIDPKKVLEKLDLIERQSQSI